jgi:hypothetical protein
LNVLRRNLDRRKNSEKAQTKTEDHASAIRVQSHSPVLWASNRRCFE